MRQVQQNQILPLLIEDLVERRWPFVLPVISADEILDWLQTRVGILTPSRHLVRPVAALGGLVECFPRRRPPGYNARLPMFFLIPWLPAPRSLEEGLRLLRRKRATRRRDIAASNKALRADAKAQAREYAIAAHASLKASPDYRKLIGLPPDDPLDWL